MRQPIARGEFDSWSKLVRFRHPVKDVLIVDPYLMSVRSKEEFRNNLIKMLDTLFKMVSINNLRHINIICRKLEKQQFEWEVCKKIVEDELSKYNVNVVLFSGSNEIHSRGVFTNYWYINFGKGINIFNANNNLKTENEAIAFELRFSKRTFNLIKPRIKEANEVIKHAKKRKENGGTGFYGNLVPNQLDFLNVGGL